VQERLKLKLAGRQRKAEQPVDALAKSSNRKSESTKTVLDENVTYIMNRSAFTSQKKFNYLPNQLVENLKSFIALCTELTKLHCF